MSNRGVHFHTISVSDYVYSQQYPVLRAFHRTWPTANFMGRILAKDVGKRVSLIDGIIQVESDEQLVRRLTAMA